ncbi:MAG: galactose-1-phosphate uridylyltransferase [Planctomycetota bacterium]
MIPSELRKDPLSQRWVIIAAERAKRPTDFDSEVSHEAPAFDPFAPGNEDKTPAEIASYRKVGTLPNKPGWRIRVVPNKYPALQIEGSLDKRGEGIYDSMKGVGAHEVIIDTPETVASFTGCTDEHVQEILWMYRDRLVDLSRDKRLKYGMLFKNVGRSAGATVYHSHSQLIVTPIVPHHVEEKLNACKRFYDFRGRCLLCDIAIQEVEQKARLVMDSGQFIAFEPYAARTPFETWILPKNHASHFETLNQPLCEELAYILKRTVAKIEKGLKNTAYNYMIFTAPFHAGDLQHFHWHIEIIPRLTRQAGFEWGTGFYINPVPPEDAAEFLRSVKI